MTSSSHPGCGQIPLTWPSAVPTHRFTADQRSYLIGPAFMAHGQIRVAGVDLDTNARRLLFTIAVEGVVPADELARTLQASPESLRARMFHIMEETGGWIEHNNGGCGGVEPGDCFWRLTPAGAQAIESYLASILKRSH